MQDGRWRGSGRGVARCTPPTSAAPNGPAPDLVRSRPAPGFPRSTATLLLTVLLTLLVAALASIARPVSPASADTTTQLQVSLTRLSPAIVHPDSTIVFEGRVTNVGNRPLVRLQAMIWRDLTPITDRVGLAAANASAPSDPEGARMYQQPPWYADLYTADRPSLAPGASRTFRLSASATDLLASSAPASGLYLAGVQVRENGVATVGRARTYLPVVTDPAAGTGLQPGQVAIGTSTLVQLDATPSMVRTGLFTDDDLATEIAPGGRLDDLLTAAELPGASYAVDPDLIVALRSMRSGYQVIGADGRLRTGAGTANAAQWLTRFAGLRSLHDGYQLLYGRPDLTSLVHAGRLDIVRAGEQAAAEVSEVKALPLMIIPAGGAADRQTLLAAQQLGARAVVLADTSVGGLGPVVSTPGSPIILSYDTEAATGGPGPDPWDTEVQLRQASLADTYIDSISGRPADTLGRLRLVSDAGQAGGESAASTAPWLRARPVSRLLTATPQPLRGRLNYPATARSHELTPRQLDRIADLQSDLRTYRNALAQPAGVNDLIDQALPRAASIAWRNHRGAMAQYLRGQRMLLTGQNGSPVSIDQLVRGTAVRVESNPQVTLTGASGQIPVTIVNTLDTTLKLQLLAQSPNRSRLTLRSIPPSTLGAIGPGARLPAQVMAHADANGTLPVTFRLATSVGEPVGEAQTMRVHATRAGLVGWVIALAAGIVLLGTVVLRIRQVARERSDAEDGEPPTVESADAEPAADSPAGAPAATGPGDGLSRNGVAGG